jgi:hypothetical protein
MAATTRAPARRRSEHRGGRSRHNLAARRRRRPDCPRCSGPGVWALTARAPAQTWPSSPARAGPAGAARRPTGRVAHRAPPDTLGCGDVQVAAIDAELDVEDHPRVAVAGGGPAGAPGRTAIHGRAVLSPAPTSAGGSSSRRAGRRRSCRPVHAPVPVVPDHRGRVGAARGAGIDILARRSRICSGSCSGCSGSAFVIRYAPTRRRRAVCSGCSGFLA